VRKTGSLLQKSEKLEQKSKGRSGAMSRGKKNK
jgi:hypothetical protein